MSLAKVVLIGGIGAGVALWFLHSKTAGASSASTAPTPGPGATSQNIPNPIAGTGMPTLKQTMWTVDGDASGQQPGTFLLTQNAANPNDWVLAFHDAQGGASIIGYSQTPNGGLLAQAAAGGQ